MKDRIAQLIEQVGLTNSEFANRIGVSSSSLHHIFSGRNNPSLDLVYKIHAVFPQVDVNWLLFGEDAKTPSAIKPLLPLEPQLNFDETPKPSALEVVSQVVSKGEEKRQAEVVSPTPAPRIVEIRLFFDNGTYEIFTPAQFEK